MHEVAHQRGTDPLPTESGVDRHLLKVTVRFGREREREPDPHFTSSRNVQQISSYRFSKECIAGGWIVGDLGHSRVAKQRACPKLKRLQRSDVANSAGAY